MNLCTGIILVLPDLALFRHKTTIVSASHRYFQYSVILVIKSRHTLFSFFVFAKFVDWNWSKAIKVNNHKKSCDRSSLSLNICRLITIRLDRQLIFIDYLTYMLRPDKTRNIKWKLLIVSHYTVLLMLKTLWKFKRNTLNWWWTKHSSPVHGLPQWTT